VMREAQEPLELATAEAERGVEAVRSLMAFARQGSLQTQILDTKAQMKDMSGLLRQAVGAYSSFDMSIDEDLWPININANQLELALLNLVVNARDAMPNGGKLRVVARNTSLAGAPDGLTGNFVEISVSDNGTGMAPETAARVFEPFFTTKDEGKGTGIGLSQVYETVKERGGTATVTSAIGRGTTVAIYIPRCDGPTPAAGENPRAGER